MRYESIFWVSLLCYWLALVSAKHFLENWRYVSSLTGGGLVLWCYIYLVHADVGGDNDFYRSILRTVGLITLVILIDYIARKAIGIKPLVGSIYEKLSQKDVVFLVSWMLLSSIINGVLIVTKAY